MRTRFYRVYFLILVVLLLLYVPACKNSSIIENQEGPESAEGALMSYTGCKTNTANTFQQKHRGSVNQEENRECITYEFIGSTLTLKHVNTFLNCCPGEITADISLQGKSITIAEKEAELGCLCDCYYDIDYKVSNITADVYTISFQHGEGVTFVCTLDLASISQGTICQ
jgi:hypothetical protein